MNQPWPTLCSPVLCRGLETCKLHFPDFLACWPLVGLYQRETLEEERSHVFLPLPVPNYQLQGFPDSSAGKESACNAGDPGSIPGSRRAPGERKDYPLQYSGLETKSRRQLSDSLFSDSQSDGRNYELKQYQWWLQQSHGSTDQRGERELPKCPITESKGEKNFKRGAIIREQHDVG